MPGPDPRTAYDRMRAAHLAAVRAALEDHVARLDWPRERLERYRTERLRALLAFAVERSPFHAARLAGIDPATATVDDLARVPPLTKQEAQEHWDAVVTVPGLDRAGAERVLAGQAWFSYTPEGLQVFSSGGSSGVRGVYVWDWEQFVTLACLAWRWQVRAERAAGTDGRAAVLAVLESGVPPHASTPLFDVATGPVTRTVVVPASAPFAQVAARIADVRPTQLVGYASVVGRLARATLAGELDLAPTRVSTNSEPLTTEDRAAMAAAWGAPVHDLWGSTEIGVQAVGCGVGEGLHVCEDEVVLERAGTRTLATGLAGRAFPFVRYDLGDEVTLLDEPCPCGSPMRRVAAVAGRRDDDFRYGDRTVPASAFRHVLGTDPRVAEYQVRQTAAGAEVLVVGSPDPDALAAALAAGLVPYGLPDAAITVTVVDRIPRHATTGKLARFVPLRPVTT